MAATDITGGGEGQPATHAFSITPDDSSEFANVTRAIYVGGEGDVAVLMMGGESVVLAGVPAGQVLPVRARKVFSTGTTATLIVGLL